MPLLEPTVWDSAFYSGGWTKASDTITVTEVATGRELGRIGSASPDDLNLAVERARGAQRAWAALPYSKRAEVLRKAAEIFRASNAEIAEWSSREAGQAAAMAGGQGLGAAEECFEAAALASVPYGKMLRSRAERLSFARHVPVGVVGVIAPFNAPIILALRAIAPALALGNAVVVKPDPRTAVVGGALFAQVFAEAGLPENLLHVLPGGVPTGEALVKHPYVPVIAFTGSTEGGRAIARLAAERVKRVHLELGGNSAMIVLDDADLGLAAAAGAAGSFRHQGQICMATGRHLVQDKIADEYVERLSTIASGLKVGDPTDPSVVIGPIIDERQRDKVAAIVDDSIASGARVTTGGSYEGLFYKPTVITDLTEQTPAYRQEIFGPVAPVMRFSTIEEAAALAADSEYGLSLGIITRDVMRGLAIADLIPTGAIHINDQTINDEPTIPFGGVGLSGNGSRAGGHEANLEAFTETQWVTIRSAPPVYPF